LVYWLVKRSGEFDEVQWYGGARDKGRDVIAHRHTDPRETWYIQCKRYQSVTFSTLREELDKLAEHADDEDGFAPDVIVFATATTPSPQAKDGATDYARSLGLPDPYYWGRMELDEKLKPQPDTGEEFFGPGLRAQIESLHQIPEPTQTFKGREKELDELTEATRQVTVAGLRSLYLPVVRR
jgi:hypothetical protein